MARKVFISFLGYSNYGACYYCKDGFKSLNGRYIQEATLDYLQTLEAWGDGDVAYILLTDGAKKANWLDDGHRDKNKEIIRQPGLHTTLNSRNYPFVVQPVEGIPDGNDEKEIFEIFSRVFNLLQEGDRLYFDITHGFRYLPMLVLVLQNYAKFLKNIKVEAITYGNFEGRNKNTQEALIVDLLPLSNIQDWTFAAADYLENGNAEKISNLAKIPYSGNNQDITSEIIAELAESLDLVSKDFQTCRGLNIINLTKIKKLRECIDNFIKYDSYENTTNSQPLLLPLILEVKKHFEGFEENECWRNGIKSAKWCIEHGLYQQAETICQETIQTYFCDKYGFDIANEKYREIINKCLNITLNKKAEKEEKWVGKVIKDEYVDIARSILNDMKAYDRNKFIKPYGFLSNDIRNDVNHNGMRKKPLEATELISETIKIIEILDSYLEEHESNKS